MTRRPVAMGRPQAVRSAAGGLSLGRRAACFAAGSLLAVGITACQVFDPEGTPVPAATTLASGIRGVVLLGPVCGGATRASPCTQPYSARLVVLDAAGEVVADVTSDSEGRFEVALPPGIYTIQPSPPENGDPFPIGQALSVSVGEEEYTEVGIDYDTGIR